jgi:hypothetical protein
MPLRTLISLIPLLLSTTTLRANAQTEALQTGTSTATSFSEFLQIGNAAIFTVDPLNNGEAVLWRTDGTSHGTYPLMPGYTMRSLDNDSLLVPCDDTSSSLTCLLQTNTASGTAEIWSTDGTVPGTHRVSRSPDFAFEFPVGCPVPEQNLYYFVDDSLEMVRTNGTARGTFSLDHPVTDPSSSSYCADFNGTLVYLLNNQVWQSDGTPDGTHELLSIGSPNDGFIQEVFAFGERLVMVYLQVGGGTTQFWSTDGTQTGLRQLPINLPPASGLFAYHPFGDRMILLAGNNRRQNLWITDGTVRGTHQLTNFTNPQPFGSFPFLSQFTIGDRYYFEASDGLHGFEAWSTDGTAAGTSMLAASALVLAAARPARAS